MTSEVIYQVYPSSFKDNSGDGLGDLDGIREKLPYIASLNVDSIWISPIFLCPEGPEGDGGYAVSDYKKVDPKYGSNEDFIDLVEDAHKLNLRIYTDFVLGHTSWHHEWFIESVNVPEGPFGKHYVWHDGKIDEETGTRLPPNNWLSIFGGAGWTFNEKRNQWYFHNFLPSQPATNLNEKHVQDAILDEMKFWLDQGVDGFRLDALPHINYDPQFRDEMPLKTTNPGNRHLGWGDYYHNRVMGQQETVRFLARLRKMLDSYKSNKIALGEVLSGLEGGANSMPIAAKYVHPKRGVHVCYTGALFELQDFPTPKELTRIIETLNHYFPHGGNCNTCNNHDMPRMATSMNHSVPENMEQASVRQMIHLFTCLPGAYCMYNGEELGLPQAIIPDDLPREVLKDPVAKTLGPEFARDGERTPMPWHKDEKNAGFSISDDPYLPVPKSHYPLSVDVQDKDPDSTLNFIRDHFAWRKKQPALNRHGVTEALSRSSKGFLSSGMPKGLFGLVRSCPEQTLLIFYNLTPRAMKIDPGKLIEEETRAKLKNMSYDPAEIPAYGVLVLGAAVDMEDVEDHEQISA
jgi:alpha-glucosidase